MELYKNDTGSYPAAAGDFQTDMVNKGYFKTDFVDPRGSTWWTYKYYRGQTIKPII